jgi:hypothetical protein
VPIPYVTNCGGEGPGNIPNMATGWGEIDALEAVTQSALYCNSAWVVFIDGFENGGTSAWSATRP